MISRGILSPRQHVTREIALEDVQSVMEQMPDFDVDGYVVITDFTGEKHAADLC